MLLDNHILHPAGPSFSPFSTGRKEQIATKLREKLQSNGLELMQGPNSAEHSSTHRACNLCQLWWGSCEPRSFSTFFFLWYISCSNEIRLKLVGFVSAGSSPDLWMLPCTIQPGYWWVLMPSAQAPPRPDLQHQDCLGSFKHTIFMS